MVVARYDEVFDPALHIAEEANRINRCVVVYNCCRAVFSIKIPFERMRGSTHWGPFVKTNITLQRKVVTVATIGDLDSMKWFVGRIVDYFAEFAQLIWSCNHNRVPFRDAERELQVAVGGVMLCRTDDLHGENSTCMQSVEVVTIFQHVHRAFKKLPAQLSVGGDKVGRLTEDGEVVCFFTCTKIHFQCGDDARRACGKGTQSRIQRIGSYPTVRET